MASKKPSTSTPKKANGQSRTRKKKMGRPRLLTEEKQTELVTALQANATYKLACQYAGISYASFNGWMNRGRDEFERLQAIRELDPDDPAYEEDPKPSKSEALYLNFFNAITEANAVAAVGWLQVIDRSAQVDAQWAAWQLRVRFPEDYGGQQKQQVEVSTPDPIKVEHSGNVTHEVSLDPDRISAILGVLSEVGAFESGALAATGSADDSEADEVHPDSPDR